MFHLDSKANIAGTCLITEIDLAPAFLVERFGPPLAGDGFKCTGRFTFRSAGGAVWTVYEYKLTSAYTDNEGDERVPSPQGFWSGRDAQTMSIGGSGNYGDGSADGFVQWLTAEYRRWVAGE